MGKGRVRHLKEGELANFPEEKIPQLLSPRYLAIATSLILVFSAVASLLAHEDITGKATSNALREWRERGLIDTWKGPTPPEAKNIRDDLGRKVVPGAWSCPKTPHIAAPANLAATSNSHDCFNANEKSNGILPMCAYQHEINGRVSAAWVKCVTQ